MELIDKALPWMSVIGGVFMVCFIIVWSLYFFDDDTSEYDMGEVLGDALKFFRFLAIIALTIFLFKWGFSNI